MARSNSGVSKLLTSMKKMIEEVNDQEICRRLEILMNTEKDDLPPGMIKTLLQSPAEFDPSEVPEPYTQYVKHYLFMIKRAEREKERQQKERDQAARDKAARQAESGKSAAPSRSRRPRAAAGTASASTSSSAKKAARKSSREASPS